MLYLLLVTRTKTNDLTVQKKTKLKLTKISDSSLKITKTN